MANAPKLAPGTEMQTRRTARGIEARTRRSKWHRVLQWWGRHHLDRDPDGEWRDNQAIAWGRVTGPAARATRADLRADIRLGKHAQDLRAEAVTMGGKSELRDFYGQGEAMGRGIERRLTAVMAERQRADYEREQREAYERRRRRAKVRAKIKAKA